MCCLYQAALLVALCSSLAQVSPAPRAVQERAHPHAPHALLHVWLVEFRQPLFCFLIPFSLFYESFYMYSGIPN
jgi:hypothetical protein